ncbi:MAG: GAF domain-containing protein, partial [Anaerolineae bacterium]|nr:GAF domain-containing protein [Anaerolineae bacterium]
MEGALQHQVVALEQHLAEARALAVQERRRRQQAKVAEQEHRALAEALRDTIAALNSTLNLDEVLDRILTNVGRVVPHDGASIMLVESKHARIVRFRSRLKPGKEVDILSHCFLVAETPTLHHMAQTGRPLSIPDVTNYPEWVPMPLLEWQRSYLGTPIQRE